MSRPEAAPPTSGRPILVRSLDDALTALAAAAEHGRPVTLISPPAAAAYGGAGWFQALIAAATQAWPGVALTGVLDCADLPGLVLAGVRAGVRDLAFAGDPETFERLAAVATAAGATLHPPTAATLEAPAVIGLSLPAKPTSAEGADYHEADTAGQRNPVVLRE